MSAASKAVIAAMIALLLFAARSLIQPPDRTKATRSGDGRRALPKPILDPFPPVQFANENNVVEAVGDSAPPVLPAFNEIAESAIPGARTRRNRIAIAPGLVRGVPSADPFAITNASSNVDTNTSRAAESYPPDVYRNQTQREVELWKRLDEIKQPPLGSPFDEPHGFQRLPPPPARAKVDTQSTLMTPRGLQQCFAGKRVLFLGHSHMHRMVDEIAAALRYAFAEKDVLFYQPEFTIRKMHDSAVFFTEYGSLLTLRYRKALRALNGSLLDSLRYDVIYVTRSMWDLVFYDTHPKDFVDSYASSLKEILQFWLKENGILVVHPLYRVKHELDKRGCYSKYRASMIRHATLAAVKRLSRDTGVPIVGANPPKSNKQSIMIFDVYRATEHVPNDHMADGHHASPQLAKLFAEVLLRGSLNCIKPVPLSDIQRAMGESFLAAIPEHIEKYVATLEATAKSLIPWGSAKCRCGLTTIGIDAIHPSCVHLGPKNKQLMIERYSKQPLVGATELQMKQLLQILCKPIYVPHTAHDVELIDCLRNIGVRDDTPADLTIPLPPPPQQPFAESASCTCAKSTSTTQGIFNPKCQDVGKNWDKVWTQCSAFLADTSVIL